MAESARKGSFTRKLPQGPQVPQSPVALGRTSFPDDTGLSPSSTPWAVGFPALTVCSGSGRSVASGTLEGGRNGGATLGLRCSLRVDTEPAYGERESVGVSSWPME